MDYQIQINDGDQWPVNCKPILKAADALYWADRIRDDLIPGCAVDIVRAEASDIPEVKSE